MAKGTIKSKMGTTIIVEGSPEEVAKILADFERKTLVEKTKVIHSAAQKEKKEEKKRQTTSDLIIELKEEGFFENSKTLGDISSSLEDKGYLCPTTTLSGIVLGFVKKKILRRKKVEGKWVYDK